MADLPLSFGIFPAEELARRRVPAEAEHARGRAHEEFVARPLVFEELLHFLSKSERRRIVAQGRLQQGADRLGHGCRQIGVVAVGHHHYPPVENLHQPPLGGIIGERLEWAVKTAQSVLRAALDHAVLALVLRRDPPFLFQRLPEGRSLFLAEGVDDFLFGHVSPQRPDASRAVKPPRSCPSGPWHSRGDRAGRAAERKPPTAIRRAPVFERCRDCRPGPPRCRPGDGSKRRWP